MKRALAVLLLLLSVMPLCALAGDNTIIPGHRVNGFILDQTKLDETLKTLGQPENQLNMGPMVEIDYTQKYRMRFRFRSDTKKLANIYVENTYYKTIDGIGVGDAQARVQTIYGKAVDTCAGRRKDCTDWIYPDKGIQFSFLEGTIVEIFLFKGAGPGGGGGGKKPKSGGGGGLKPKH